MRSGLAACVALGLLACSSAEPASSDTGPALEDCDADRWVGAWAAAPSGTTDAVADQTLRLVFTPLRSGATVRVRLSNRFGESPLALGSVHLGVQDAGAAIRAGTQRAVTFDGAGPLTLPAGGEVVSDPVDLAITAMEPLALSVHVPADDVALTRHVQGHQTSFTAPGDVAADPSADAFTGSRTDRPLVMGLDVLGPGDAAVVAAIGDSLTDGDQAGPSSIDADTRYPDALARRLLDAGSPLSPVNLGIGGNRVLQDAALPDFGPALVDRLDADLLSRDDVTDVLLFAGINDLGLPPGATAEALLDGLDEAVAALDAQPDPPRVHVATLTPAGGGTGVLAGYAAAEETRQAVNAEIRAERFGPHVLDFDAVARDPARPTHLAPGFDGGDGLHLSADGYAALAASVDLDTLRGRRCAD